MQFETLLKSAANQRRFLVVPPTSLSCRGGGNGNGNGCGGASGIADAASHAQEVLRHYCSFPDVPRHPRQASLETQSQSWLTELYGNRLPAAQVQRLLDARIDTLGCVFYPHGSSDARSLPLIKQMYWYFILDDVLDDPHLLGHNYDAALRFARRQFKAMFGSNIVEAQAVGLLGAHGYGDDDDNTRDDDQHDIDVRDDLTVAQPAGTDIQVETALAAAAAGRRAEAQKELVIEVGVQWVEEMSAQGMSQRQLERLREGVAEYLVGILSIVRLRQEKRLPELEEYIRIRRMDGADKLVFLSCEYDIGIELDDETLASPLVKELNWACADQALWLNDLLSFNREFHNDDYVSLVAVLCYKSSAAAAAALDQPPTKMVDLQEALSKAQAMIKARDQERVRLVHEIRKWKPQLQPYVEATHSTVSGLTFWTLWSSRYKDESSNNIPACII